MIKKNAAEETEKAENALPTPAVLQAKKDCQCCVSTLEKVRQKRESLEMWAREMINTYGYEDGMKRITAKSKTLAKRIQGILEAEKNGNESVVSVK